MASSPVREVPFGQALSISLNNYYDLLKAQVGGLATEEYLQLKLVADAVDISEAKYKWFSYYHLLRRSDQAITPTPVQGVVMTAVSDLALQYERFLRQLRTYVVKSELSADDQKKIAEYDVESDRLRKLLTQYAVLDRTNWRDWAELMGYDLGDTTAYVQWRAFNGHQREMEDLARQLREVAFDKKTVLDRQYKEPTDREVIDAEFDFESPAMRIRYPIHPDFEYPDGANFTVTYLANLPIGSSALFDDRRVLTWDKTLGFIQTAAAGSFSATFDRSTSESKSIETDWGHSGNVGYAFIRVNSSASEHTKIVEDFKKATSITLSAAAAFKVAISYPTWFRQTLFTHKRVVENIHDFESFFGPNGSLLYYPSHLILVRGFKAEFSSAQDWSFDYKRTFSASAGGGFSIFGISFGGSNSYSNQQKEHKVDQATTKLTIEDDPSTVRFVGYAVKRNTVFDDAVEESLRSAMDESTVKALLA